MAKKKSSAKVVKAAAPKKSPAKSTKKTAPAKSPAARPKPAPVAAAPKVDKPARVKIEKLSKKEMNYYLKLLLTKRAELVGDIGSMSAEALADDSDLSHMPLHMADVGSDHYEQELTLGLVESERKLLGEINDAIKRIAEGSYGICEATGQPIGKARLEAKPWAKYCIEAARELERTGQR